MNETKELLKDIVFGIQKLFPLLKRGEDRHGELIEKIEGLEKSGENLEVVNTLKEVKQSIEKIELKVPKLQKVKVVNQVEVPEEVKVKKPEWLPNIKSVASDLAQVFVYESTTFNANGSQRTPIALERNGTYTPKLQIWEDPTVNAVGTLIWQGVLFGSRATVGDLTASDNEFVLKNNTSYNLRVTSGANGCKVLIRMVWYEDLGV